MTIRFSCHKCGRKYQTPDDSAGKKTKCSGCGEALTVPASVSEEQPLEELVTDQPPQRPAAKISDENSYPPKRTATKPAGRSGSKVLLIVLACVAVLGLCCTCPVGLMAMLYFRAGEARDIAMAERQQAERNVKMASDRTTDALSNLDRLSSMDAGEFKRLLGDEAMFLPDGFSDLQVRRPGVLLKSPAYQKFNREEQKNPEFDLGLRDAVGEDLPYPPAVVRELSTQTGMRVFVMSLPATERDLAEFGAKGTERQKVAGREAFLDSEGLLARLWVIDGARLISGPPEMMKAILSRNGAPKISAPMAQALRVADFTKPDVQIAMEVDSLRGNGVLEPKGRFWEGDAHLDSVVVEADWSNPVSFTARVAYRDSATASRTLAEFNVSADRQRSGLSASVSGNTVVYRSALSLRQ